MPTTMAAAAIAAGKPSYQCLQEIHLWTAFGMGILITFCVVVFLSLLILTFRDKRNDA